MPAEAVAYWQGILNRIADDPDWLAGTETLGALPRIREIRDPAQFVRQQAQFYERLVIMLGARP